MAVPRGRDELRVVRVGIPRWVVSLREDGWTYQDRDVSRASLVSDRPLIDQLPTWGSRLIEAQYLSTACTRARSEGGKNDSIRNKISWWANKLAIDLGAVSSRGGEGDRVR
jgi:hypothetical protein